MEQLRDLPSRKDPKGGSPKTPAPIPISEYNNSTTPSFLKFTLANWLTIIFLAGLLASYWLKHETSSAATSAVALALAEENARRFSAIELRIQRLEAMKDEVVPDVRELKTKLNIMVELLDGDHKRPELHK